MSTSPWQSGTRSPRCGSTRLVLETEMSGSWCKCRSPSRYRVDRTLLALRLPQQNRERRQVDEGDHIRVCRSDHELARRAHQVVQDEPELAARRGGDGLLPGCRDEPERELVVEVELLWHHAHREQ